MKERRLKGNSTLFRLHDSPGKSSKLVCCAIRKPNNHIYLKINRFSYLLLQTHEREIDVKSLVFEPHEFLPIPFIRIYFTWHESLPPSRNPAQNMLFVILEP